MNFKEHYFNESDAKLFTEEVRLVLEQEQESIGIDPVFISRLCNYIEKGFPSYGNFQAAITNELRSRIDGDNSYVKSVRKRIIEIVNKCRDKFLHDVANKVEKIKVQPKNKPQSPPPMGNGLGDTSTGETSQDGNY